MDQDLRKTLERAQRIQLLLMDVDGVLADGKLYYVPDASGTMIETKAFNVTDGQGLRWLHKAGISTGLISVGNSPGVQHRADLLGIKYCYQGCSDKDKLATYEKIRTEAGLPEEAICYVGDDLTDAPIMQQVGLAIAVANARPKVKAIAHYITSRPGGRGAIREVAELLLQAQGKWLEILKQYGL
jgi:3-deoxy-D-manno-octulosonate 8-phosphate phosphatase (KDO 8-P phosphatase)